MQWTRKVTTVLVACCIGGGIGAVFNMPVVLTATAPPDQSIAPLLSILPAPSNPSVHAPVRPPSLTGRKTSVAT